MRPLLFRHLLSQHPVLPTPEGSWRLLFQVLHRFHGLRYGKTSSAPSFPFRAKIPTLQDSFHIAGCCFAPLSLGVTTLLHSQSPSCTGCLLRGHLDCYHDRTCTGKQMTAYRTHLPFLRELQRFGTASHPTAPVACYVASCQLPRPDLHRYAGDGFQDALPGSSEVLVNSRPICTSHSRLYVYHQKECGGG